MTDDPDPIAPEGVTLWNPHDAKAMRGMIENDVLASLKKHVHGFEYGNVRLELHDLALADKPEYTLQEQREATLADKTLSRRIRGTVRLVDRESGRVLDQKKNHTILRVPWLTESGTVINAGTHQSLISQSRLLPGPYTRVRDNGETACHLVARPGTGKAMKVTMDPESAQYRIHVGGASGSSNVHAYSLFNALGVPDDDLERRWGKDVLAMNRQKVDSKALDRFYEKAVPKWSRTSEAPTQSEKAEAVRNALAQTQVTTSILHENLPTLVDREKAASWRALGAAMDLADKMEKAAGVETFAPDLSPAQLAHAVSELDFDMCEKSAFHPDIESKDLTEARQYLHAGYGPRLASMASWPEHWLNDEDPSGWLEWYDKYSQGRRIPDDERQIMRWRRFKRLHGAKFRLNPSPRRAYALRNWAIDPLRLLDPSERAEMQKAMDAYRGTEYVKWFMTRHGFDADAEERLLQKAVSRGYRGEGTKPKQLLDAAAQGFLTPDDT